MSTFNPPPRWPEPPEPGWQPPENWTPPREWGPAPAGWRLRAEDHPTSEAPGTPRPLVHSEDVPASGARPPRTPDTYPVTVHVPGQWEEHEVSETTYGFGPAPERRSRPRLRLAVIIGLLALGLLLAAATAFGFVQLARFGSEQLPSSAIICAPLLVAPRVAHRYSRCTASPVTARGARSHATTNAGR